MGYKSNPGLHKEGTLVTQIIITSSFLESKDTLKEDKSVAKGFPILFILKYSILS